MTVGLLLGFRVNVWPFLRDGVRNEREDGIWDLFFIKLE
jgi:hypothetical protein